VIPHVVNEAARRFRDRVAFVGPDGDELSYIDLYHRSVATARQLAGRGVGIGDVVALAMPSSLDYVIAYLASAHLGAVTAGVNPRLGA
jgi:acyl-CoA synthetase (AMP-forming)/AMP-acid ligase II